MKIRSAFIVSGAFAFLGLPAALLPLSAQERALTLGGIIQGKMQGGETQSFRVAADSGQFLEVRVEQKGIDLEVILSAPGGALMARSDLPNGAWGPETVAVIAASTGSHTVVLKVPNPKLPAGEYEVRLAALRTPALADRQRLAAIEAFTEARRLRAQRTAESRLQAIAKFNLALKDFELLEDTHLQALSLNEIGSLHAELGDFRRALSYYDRAIPIARRRAEPQILPLFLLSAGGAYDVLGDVGTAREQYEEALKLARGLRDPLLTATALNNIGKLYHDQAAWQKALRFYREALPLFQAAGDLRREAIALANIGTAYNTLGEPETGRGYFRQAIERQRAAGNPLGQAGALNNLGMTYALLGQPEEAIPYYEQALDLFRKLGDQRSQGHSLNYIGVARATMGETARALPALEQALQLLRQAGDKRWEGIVLGNLGSMYGRSGNPEAAVEASSRALDLLGKFGDANTSARTHLVMARAERERGHLEVARREVEAALALTEQVRAGAGGEQSRATYLASTQDAFEFYIDLLMQLHRANPREGYAIAALEANERGRARSLLELLAESGVDLRQGADPGLLAQERNLEEHIQAKSARLLPLLARRQDDPLVATLTQEMRSLQGEYEQVRLAIREKSPHYASVTQPSPLRLSGIQALLEDGSALLEYSLGEQRSYLWVVTAAAMRSYELPGRAQIDGVVRRIHELVTARAVFPRLEAPDQRRTRIVEADRLLEQATAEAARMLLPAVGDLGASQVVIAADGALQQLPFALLPGPRGDVLLDSHQIVSVPSASVLAVLRQELAARPRSRESIAVFADPVFGPADPRVKSGSLRENTRGAAADDSALRILEHLAQTQPGATSENAKRMNIPRLPHTRSEAQRILTLARRGGNLEALGFRATRSLALTADLAPFRYVHFATHGFLDTERPGLSSIVLSLVDQTGTPQDGFLRANDIYNLKLSADLVVLSACNTGLGRQIRGEGIMGLTRGFLYAGAARVLVSLWNVNDESTAVLMGRIYTKMLAEGKSAAAALREAQSEVRKDKRWRSPYYWAAFVQQGEWR